MFAAYRGEPAPSAPLTWGQVAIWRSIMEFATDHSVLHLRRVVAVPRGGAEPATVLNAIGALVSRHSSLRTRIRVVDGDLRQVPVEHGLLPVHIATCTSEDGEDGIATAAAVQGRLGAMAFDHAEDLPVRFGLVVVGHRVSQLVVIFSHVTVDLYSSEIILRELRLLLLRGSIATPPGLQSVDVALREQGPARRRSERAIEYWVSRYEALPKHVFDEVGPPLQPPFGRTVLVSKAIESSARIIAGRHRVSTSTVLLAATAVLLTAWTGRDGCGVYTMVHNRIQADYAQAIAKLNQLGLFALDLADRPTFAEVLPRAWQAAVDAYRHAYYDIEALDRALEAIGRPPGAKMQPRCYFNDLRLPGSGEPDADGSNPRPPVATADADAEAAVRALLAESVLTQQAGLDEFTWQFRLQVMDAPAAVAIALTTDTRYLPPERATGFLRDFEELLVRAAFGDVPWPWAQVPSSQSTVSHWR